jgi:hypothetical protein
MCDNVDKIVDGWEQTPDPFDEFEIDFDLDLEFDPDFDFDDDFNDDSDYFFG